MSNKPTVEMPLDQVKAEQVASIILEAARADVGLLRAEMTGVRSATTAIRDELMLLANKADVLRAHADLQARIERVERRLMMGFSALTWAVAAIMSVNVVEIRVCLKWPRVMRLRWKIG